MSAKPNVYILYAISLLLGAGIAAAIVWLFGIEISSLDRLTNFPDGWSVIELIWNATAGLLLVGSVRGVYIALRAHYYGDVTDDPPSPGAGSL